MVDLSDFTTLILTVLNEKDAESLNVLIEPHLELYEVPPGKLCEVLYPWNSDNSNPDKRLEVAQREDCFVIYPPGKYAPLLMVDGRHLENKWHQTAPD